MSTDLAVHHDAQRGIAEADPEAAAGALAHILGTGDLARLSNEQRVGHYLDVCASLGLNPRTRPFDWIEFYDPQTRAKKLALYPNRSCAEQLRRQHQISVHFTRREVIGDKSDEPMFVCEVEGTTPTGRQGVATKYVPLVGSRQDGTKYRLSGSALANAYMKAETGALRRLTFSMVGMASPPDADELARARMVVVDGTGNVLEHPTDEQRYLAEVPAAARAIGAPTFEDVAHAADGPLAGHASQAVSPGELEQPRQPRPPAMFRASEEDVKRWLGAWFAAIKGLSLDTDEARHRFVSAWTAAEWPEGKRTHSLRTAFARMSESEASDFLAHVRALMEDERRELLDWRDADGNEAGADVGMTPEQAHAEAIRQGDPSITPPSGRRDKVRDSALLTGADISSEPAF